MTNYTPSPRLTAALAVFAEAQAHEQEARAALRDAVAVDLVNTGATTDEIAPHTPWSSETLRIIARERGVPLKRKATVRSIKPKRRTDV